MIYGRDYQTGNPQCADGHECEYVEMCAKCDGDAYCEKHLTQCEGCKKQFCAKHAAELAKTDCGLLCEDCEAEYDAKRNTVPALVGSSGSGYTPRYASIGPGMFCRVGRRAG